MSYELSEKNETITQLKLEIQALKTVNVEKPLNKIAVEEGQKKN